MVAPFLTPTSTPVLEDQALEDFFQIWLVGLTGLPGGKVRPRWQPEPPNIPDFGVDWAAIGIVRKSDDTFAAELHPSPGVSQLRRHEEVHLLATFYGPNAGKFAKLFQDGMQIAQNREYLTLAGMGLIESGEILNVPEIIKDRWVARKDLPFSVRRQVLREYAVADVEVGDMSLNNERYITPIVVNN